MKVLMGDVMKFEMRKIFYEKKRRKWEDKKKKIKIIGNIKFSV
jgi:hypothetical protein